MVLKGIRTRTQDFGELVSTLPGIYPSNVINSLQRLSYSHPVQSLLQSKTVAQPQARNIRATRQVTSLPRPHPLDFDWRFSHDTVQNLLKVCLSNSLPGDRLVLLGVPTLFFSAQGRVLTRDFILVDKNPAYKEGKSSINGQIICRNLLGGAPLKLEGKVVVADPPWYKEYTQAFLWHASNSCRLGGHVFITRPGNGTRPGMQEEWRSLIHTGNRLGLRFLGIEPFDIRYESPYFEENALRKQGIHNVPQDWRRASLARFVKVRPHSVDPPEVDKLEEWSDNTQFGIRLRFKESIRFRDPTLKSIVDGDVLPSVSRSVPQRHLADVWTHGNRIFMCEGTYILQLVLNSVAKGTSPQREVRNNLRRTLSIAEAEMVSKAYRQLKELIDTEKREAEGF
jgi:hypothetical protein